MGFLLSLSLKRAIIVDDDHVNLNTVRIKLFNKIEEMIKIILGT